MSHNQNMLEKNSDKWGDKVDFTFNFLASLKKYLRLELLELVLMTIETMSLKE